jgi:poly-gamma-glutamate capsule biosynthesis protein CapA/YwtB (metallophosphatase superfamily)
MAKTARLLAVGDLQLGDSATCVGFGFRSKVSTKRLEFALRDFTAAMGESALTFANLETPLSDTGLEPSGRRSRQLRGRPDYVTALRAAGFTVLNVANNHSLEHGPRAFLDSVSRVEAAGIEVVGKRGAGEWSSQPVTITLSGLRVGILGYTLRRTPENAERLHAEPNEAEIRADVARLRASVDTVIVSLHWGEEFVQVPSTSEVELAHALVDAGASLILGHHPHVARPVERYRDAVIAYSLGNFVADMIWHAPLRRGLVLDCELMVGGVAGVRVHETRIDDGYLPRVDLDSSVAVATPVSIAPLPQDAYISQARATVQAQRRALYGYTVRNAWQFEPRMLLDLALKTVRGKLGALSGRSRDAIWG